MRPTKSLQPFLSLTFSLILVSASQLSLAQSDGRNIVVETEFGASWQSRNDVQIPNDNLGTRFALDEIAGSGPWLLARFNLLWNINEKHGFRVLLAPLSYTESNVLESDVSFAGTQFQSGEAVEASYKFNSWRVSYRYHMIENDNLDLWLGGTLKIRDAEIKLRQGQVTANDDDLGVVPLFYVAARYRLGERWHLNADMDALAGGPGRAIDLGLRVDYTLNPNWEIGAGLRTLEGGVDSDDVYNFAWFNSVVFSTRYKF